MLETNDSEKRSLMPLSWAQLAQFVAVAFQFGLLVLMVRAFELENRAFLKLIVLAWGGFVVHHFLPLRFRIPFFAGLSLAGVGVVLGLAAGAWLVGIGLFLIGLAHLPVPFRMRLILLGLVGGTLMAFRIGWLSAPWPAPVWPILGSMFMFRLMLYLYDLRHGAAPFDLWRALAYFFMLPNVCFPLFPVVDYKTFCRSHYNDDTYRIYQTGIRWMFRGIIHLLLYRVVYQNLLVDPAMVSDAGGAARSMVATFLLYLRVSGDFHLIVGMLHLFGFNLPEVFHQWLLSSSFTNFWRRINIYWKDFMQKVFFNPVYFRLKKRMGDTSALCAATAFVFLVTWALHSYQWFWIRGSFPVTWQDTVFWCFLATMVLVNMLYENRYGRWRGLKAQRRKVWSGLGLALRTVGMFIVIVTVWSLWTATSFAEWGLLISNLTVISASQALWILGSLAALGVAAVIFDRRSGKKPGVPLRSPTGSVSWLFWRPVLTVSTASGLILLIGNSPILFASEPQLADAIVRMQSANRLNRQDAKMLERGYYEDLTQVVRFNTELAQLYFDMPPDWSLNPAIYQTPEDYPPYKLLPSTRVPFKRTTLTTNRWGMRDREYERQKPAGTFRIALLGASFSMGSGVEDGETFENVAEDRLNRESVDERYSAYEILNFAVGGYGPLSKLTLLESEVFSFEPDAVVYEAIDDLRWILNELAYAAEKDIRIPQDHVVAVAREAGVEPGLPRILTEQRMRPHAVDLLRWVYGQFVEKCRQHGVRAFATFLPKPVDQSAKIHGQIAQQMEMAREAGFTILDTSGAYAQVEDLGALWLARWDRHPNAQGHRLLADKLYEKLQLHIGERAITDRQRSRVLMPGKNF